MTKQVPQRYKQTPVGVIPEDWEVVKLGDVLKIGGGKDYKHLGHGNIPVYGSGGYMLSVDKFLYDGESACIGRKGTIDKPMFLSGKFWTVDTLFFTHSFKNTFPQYIYMVFLDIDWLLYNEASGVPSLTKSAIESIQISLPPITEQEKIVEVLSTWDGAITKQEKLIEQKQQFKKSIMQQIFSQKLRFKDDDGSEYPAWEENKLGDLFDYKNGGSFEKHVVDNGTYKLITLNSIDITGILKEEHKTVNITDNSLNINDLVMVLSDVAHGHFLGLTDIIDADDYVLNQRMGALKPKVDISVFFVKTFINYSQKYFKLKGQGSSQQNLSKGDIVSFRVNLPCLKEQNKIAEFLTTIYDEITKQNEVLAELKLQKKSLMQKLLTGQVRAWIPDSY